PACGCSWLWVRLELLRSFRGLFLLLRQDGFGASDVAAGLAELRVVAQLLGGLLHAQAEMGLQQIGDFFLEAGHVLAAEFRCFHVYSPCAPQAPTWRATKVVFS